MTDTLLRILAGTAILVAIFGGGCALLLSGTGAGESYAMIAVGAVLAAILLRRASSRDRSKGEKGDDD